MDVRLTSGAIPLHTISLEPLESQQLRELLACWAPDGETASDLSVFADHPIRAIRELAFNRNAAPLRAILSSVCCRWAAVAVLERPYMDLEFWDSHAGFYERCFRPYPVDCERLHFFALSHGTCGRDLLLQGFAAKLCTWFQQGKTWPEVTAEVRKQAATEPLYIGYCVLRPIRSYSVSRTAIRFDTTRFSKDTRPCGLELLPEEFDALPVLRVAQPCTAHLLNARLTVETPEFIQQDPHLGPCATASLWVATRRISAADAGVARFPFTAITSQAIGAMTTRSAPNVVWDPMAGDTGFTADQIKSAVCQCGWHTIESNPARREPLKHQSERLRYAAFSFLDSGLPPLLCMTDFRPDRRHESGHVVALVGYSLPGECQLDEVPSASEHLNSFVDQADEARRLKIEERHMLLSSAVQVYYAHDDAYGPFNRVHFFRTLRQEDQERCLASADPGAGPNADQVRADFRPILEIGRVKPRLYRVSRILVPVPLDVRNGPENVLVDALQRFDKDALPRFAKELKDARFLWRTVLAEGAVFKRSLDGRGFRDELRAWYATLHLPKYVWVAEVSVVEKEEFSDQFVCGSRRQIDGEFLYDATAPLYDLHWISDRIQRRARDWRQPADWRVLGPDCDEATFCFESLSRESADGRSE